MAKLIFNGLTHQISLVGDGGNVVGTWTAYNNVDRHATLTHLQNGSYAVTDRRAPFRHRLDANSPYGLHGVIRFDVAGHPGIGVHAGRANASNLPGPAHPTMGCIRTSDEAMMAIAASMSDNPLATVERRGGGSSPKKGHEQSNKWHLTARCTAELVSVFRT